MSLTWKNFGKYTFSLLIFAGLIFLLESLLESKFPFYLDVEIQPGLFETLSILPLICIALIFLRKISPLEHFRQIALTLGYIITFVLLSPYLWVALASVAAFYFIFILEKLTPKTRTFFILFLFLILISLAGPVVLYSSETPLSTAQIYFLLLFKFSLAMRLISWLVDRRVYLRTEYSSLWDFLEYTFCPIFFIFPGQIQNFLYRYFHQNKGELPDHASYLKNFAMGLWGISLMAVYGYLSWFFWKKIFYYPYEVSSDFLPLVHLGIGLYWVFALYFQQTAAMAFQISLARLLGYQFKYDMHYPLLARSPIDFLRRNGSYTMDYVVEVGYKPLSYFLLKKRIRPVLVLPLIGAFTYAMVVLSKTGYRPGPERLWVASLVLAASVCLYICLSYMNVDWSKSAREQRNAIDTIADPIDHKPWRSWTTNDYWAWAGTLLLLAASNSLLGIVQVIFGVNRGL